MRPFPGHRTRSSYLRLHPRAAFPPSLFLFSSTPPSHPLTPLHPRSALGLEDMEVVDPNGEKKGDKNREVDEKRSNLFAQVRSCCCLPFYLMISRNPFEVYTFSFSSCICFFMCVVLLFACALYFKPRARPSPYTPPRAPSSSSHPLPTPLYLSKPLPAPQVKQYMGKDVMSLVSVPVWVMEPFTTLQKMAEIMEHAEYLDMVRFRRRIFHRLPLALILSS
jgi:hypothetical protein